MQNFNLIFLSGILLAQNLSYTINTIHEELIDVQNQLIQKQKKCWQKHRHDAFIIIGHRWADKKFFIFS